MKRCNLKAEARLFLSAGDTDEGRSLGVGRGIIELCQRVEELGSLKQAARDMGMAYSKAWRLIKRTEEALGFQLFVRKGVRGSALTPQACALVDMFMYIEEELKEDAQQHLEEAFDRYAYVEPPITNEAGIQTQATPQLISEVKSIEHNPIKISHGRSL